MNFEKLKKLIDEYGVEYVSEKTDIDPKVLAKQIGGYYLDGNDNHDFEFLIRDFKKFKDAYNLLVDDWKVMLNRFSSENEIDLSFEDKYPFDKSFDELDVIDWCQTSIKKIEEIMKNSVRAWGNG